MIKCPKCSKLAVLFADGERNDLDALGLKCFDGCGWKLTMKDLMEDVRALKIQSCRQQLELTKNLIILEEKFLPSDISSSEADSFNKSISSLKKIRNQIADDLKILELDD